MKKKYRIAAVALFTAATLTACGSNASTENTNEAGTEATTETADAAATDASQEVELPTKTLLDYDLDKLVELGTYTGNTIEVAKSEVTDEVVESTIQSAYAANPLLKEVTGRAVQSGDTVNIDYVGVYADTKEAFQGGTANGHNLKIGSGSFIAGFEDGLIGKKTGETVELNLTFPENYATADLAGKDVIFTVTINKIQEAQAEPSDEWAASLGLEDMKTLDDYRAGLKAELQAEADENFKVEAMNQAIEAAVAGANVKEVPEELFNRYHNVVYSSVENYLQQIYYTYGVQTSVEDYMQSIMNTNGIEGTVDEYLSQIITDQTKRSMVVQAIADKEKLEVTDAEIDEFLREYYDTYYSQMFSTFEEYKASLDLEDYRETLLTDKVAEFLMNNDTVVETAG